MELTIFIKDFADQFDETALNEFAPETNYRNIDEWSSLVTLAILNMIEKKYGVRLTPIEMRPVNTIQELFDLVRSKQ